jgi:outer membrane immunogenic protein
MVALTTVARAADTPAKAPMYAPARVTDWTGVYLGIQGGAVRRDALAELGLFGFELDGSKTGGTAGAVLGYNWQHGSFVYGLEGDWSWIGAKTGHLANLGQTSTSFDINSVSTIRGRAGLALDSTLFYLTGGAAFGHIKNTFAFSVTDAVAFSFTQNETKAGWTVGAGVEHMFAPNWTARAEWRFVDLGKNGVPCKPGTQSCEAPSGEFSNTLMLGLIGVNYKFGSSHAAHGSIARPQSLYRSRSGRAAISAFRAALPATMHFSTIAMPSLAPIPVFMSAKKQEELSVDCSATTGSRAASFTASKVTGTGSVPRQASFFPTLMVAAVTSKARLM